MNFRRISVIGAGALMAIIGALVPALADKFQSPFTHSSPDLSHGSVVGEQADITTTISPRPFGFYISNRYSNGRIGYGARMCAITIFLDGTGGKIAMWRNEQMVSGGHGGPTKVIVNAINQKMTPEEQERVKSVEIDQLWDSCP